MTSTVALRTALIWHDEVMDDVVAPQADADHARLGRASRRSSCPNVGLPKNFAIVRPGNRGYLLTLGERMRGTICLDGEQKDVAEFVRRGGEGEGPGGFRATPISGKDWGVIDLDESGDYKLFFQFVPVDDARAAASPSKMVCRRRSSAGSSRAPRSAICSVPCTAASTLLPTAHREGFFRGWALAALALGGRRALDRR